MPILIDGDNLAHAMAGAGMDGDRAAVCAALEAPAEASRGACVVFDGGPPHMGRLAGRGVRVVWSGGRSADEVIEELIAADTAPRRLIVVSTDRRVRAAARRRRCRVVTSEEFARALRRLRRPAAEPPGEPEEKARGASEEETRRWLREFGLEG